MAVMMGDLYAALVKAGAGEDEAKDAAKEVANFDNRETSLEGRTALLDAKLDAKFAQVSGCWASTWG